MDELQPVFRVALALAIGLLIGLERGWNDRDAHEGARVAGVRTFALSALLGAFCALAADVFGVLLLGFAFLAFSGVMISAHVLKALDDHDYGITTTVAALLTFTLGVAAMRFEPVLVSSAAVIVVTVLGTKPLLHRSVRRLERHDLYAIFQMLLISVVALPVLPDRTFDPWGALNPYEIWLMVVLVAGVSFIGYFSIMLFGHRLGLGLTSAFGGLASSTAVTLSFARMANRSPELHRVLTAGVLFAAGTMFPRTFMLTLALSPAVAWSLAPPMAAMAVCCYAGALWFWHTARDDPATENAAPRNPLELKSAFFFGVLLTAVLVLSRVLRQWLGDAGLYLLAVVSGAADIDAVTLSMSRMAPVEIPAQLAGNVIVVAAVANTFAKGCIALAVARSKMGWHVLGVLALTGTLGALSTMF